MKNRRLMLFFNLLFLVCYAAWTQNPEAAPVRKTVTVMSFNIQTFGVSKMSKPEVVEILVSLVSRAGIIAVQEVRSRTIEPVERFMALLPERYGYCLGPRLGRTASKEQYWVIYDTEEFTVLETDTWPDTDDIFEREPYAVYFKTKSAFDFILINNHIQPRAAEKEIAVLPEVAVYYRNLWNDPDIFIVGDLNAGGSYFDESLLEQIFPPDQYYSIITGEHDTTTGANTNTYDRFIVTISALEYFTGNCGVIRFDEEYDFSRYTIQPRNVSDHYPVWAGFWVN
jgi:endonuclease/exonuclease/phosphatase family metal-dependent hydrolase